MAKSEKEITAEFDAQIIALDTQITNLTKQVEALTLEREHVKTVRQHFIDEKKEVSKPARKNRNRAKKTSAKVTATA
jgi:regulator of replication initiation timing